MRYTAFCEEHNFHPLHDLDWAAALWTESTRESTVPASRLKYISDMTAMASRLGLSTPISRMYAGGLRGIGAMVPTNQALPIRAEDVKSLAEALLRSERDGHRAYTAIYIAWKTASRWGEIQMLQQSQIRLVPPHRKAGPQAPGAPLTPPWILVEWRDRTKATSKGDCFRPDSWTLIEDPAPFPEPVTRTLRELETEQPDAYLYSRPTEWLERMMRRHLPKKEYSAHSIKAGAARFLAEALTHQLIPEELLARMLKHKVASAVPSTTIRYVARDPLTPAEMFKTNLATVLLPW